MLRKLWLDETGVINSMELILISTILVLGMIVGLVSLRNQVVQELDDTATAVSKLNQSYSYKGRTLTGPGGFSASVPDVTHTDNANFNPTTDVSEPPAVSNTPGE